MQAYSGYVRSKKLLPKVFFEQNHIDEIKGVYVPFWLYNATENYFGTFEGTKVRTWSDSRYHYTETSFFDIERAGAQDFENVPVDGSKEMPDDLMESASKRAPAYTELFQPYLTYLCQDAYRATDKGPSVFS